MKRFLSVLLMLALFILMASCKGMGEPAVQTTPVRVGVENQSPGGGQGGGDPSGGWDPADPASDSDEFFPTPCRMTATSFASAPAPLCRTSW